MGRTRTKPQNSLTKPGKDPVTGDKLLPRRAWVYHIYDRVLTSMMLREHRSRDSIVNELIEEALKARGEISVTKTVKPSKLVHVPQTAR